MENFERLVTILKNFAMAANSDPPIPLIRTRIRLLALPQKAFENVLRQMDFIFVFDLSLTSKRIRGLIKEMNFQFDCVEINNMHRRKSIVFRNNYKEPDLIFRFDEKCCEWGWQIQMGKQAILVRGRNNMQREYYCETKSFESDLKPMLDYISSVFRFRAGFAQIELNQRAAKLRELIEHPIFNNRLVIQLSGYLRDGYRGLESLLHTYRNLEGLLINFQFIRGYFDFKDIFHLKRICFVDAMWMTREDLLSLEFQRLKLLCHNLCGEDVNLFIKHWQAGGNPGLRRLDLSTAYGRNIEMVKVLDGLNVVLWDKQRRDGDYVMDMIQSPYTIDARRGYDIERSDGLLATILQTDVSFYFLVWHNPFNTQFSYPNKAYRIVNNL
ncbi:hypothetical protein CRE_05017 [Caenorhabditis remanei]|uniref:Uncharacterized protein n=1 Tax=Caenorhabditis remanei TaxID=31234 RepID=E3MZ06_CAERE|nr:hypothetical protein CRE_05017 [Caenorhabditis remanei]